MAKIDDVAECLLEWENLLDNGLNHWQENGITGATPDQFQAIYSAVEAALGRLQDARDLAIGKAQPEDNPAPLEPPTTPQQEAMAYAVSVLNEALALDGRMTRQLFESYVSVNKELADHPTIQVDARAQILGNRLAEPVYRLRPLGLINGVLGAGQNGTGYLAMELDDQDGQIANFFIITPESHPAAFYEPLGTAVRPEPEG